ncbi:hypothetical protein K457DRAFT_645242 [Linnemannia elongata AG-77]|uniref:Uncharacterized protein n=1 Tax=Linnemannia elongata AG-77 TaxID=1314771 RepID=A0A197KEC3_9FUNG|nr:hypothetical protein K457DRAFT_645242 [Linnemannia elongata AG-77]
MGVENKKGKDKCFFIDEHDHSLHIPDAGIRLQHSSVHTLRPVHHTHRPANRHIHHQPGNHHIHLQPGIHHNRVVQRHKQCYHTHDRTHGHNLDGHKPVAVHNHHVLHVRIHPVQLHHWHSQHHSTGRPRGEKRWHCRAIWWVLVLRADLPGCEGRLCRIRRSEGSPDSRLLQSFSGNLSMAIVCFVCLEL